MTRDLAAYGVGFVGLGGPDAPEPPPSWPRWTVSQEVGPADDTPGMDIWDDRARIGMPGVGEFRLDRSEQRIELRVGELWSAAALLHPGLAPAASIVAHWMGRTSLHAAAVLIDGRIWGLLGEKGAGKSTLTAHLVGLGCGMVTDDLLVIDGMDGCAGPGALDLRGDVGAELGGRPLGVIGARERWRVAMQVGAMRAPLGGWIRAEWGEGDASAEEIGAAGRLETLGANTMLPPTGACLLDLAELPMWRMTRRRATDQAGEDAGRLLELVRSSRPG